MQLQGRRARGGPAPSGVGPLPGRLRDDPVAHPAGQAVQGGAGGGLVAGHLEGRARIGVAGAVDPVGPRQERLALPGVRQARLGVEGQDQVAPLAAQVDQSGAGCGHAGLVGAGAQVDEFSIDHHDVVLSVVGPAPRSAGPGRPA